MSNGRARSNALIGFDDPRAPKVRPIEQNMAAALGQPPLMAGELKTFVAKVFNSAGIMKPGIKPGDRCSLIYREYSGGDANESDGPAKNENKFLLAIEQMMSHHLHSVAETAKFQYTEVKLSAFKAAANAGKKIRSDLYTDFLYFTIGSSAPKVRLYLNTRYVSTPNIVSKIALYIRRTGNHGVGSFKVVGPRSIDGRADSIVIYLGKKSQAESLGRELLKSPNSFNENVPAMTTRLDPLHGVAIGAEPEWQATGMDSKPKGYPESAQSFGSIRSELIAMAIENYHDNKAVLNFHESEQTTFERFVCAAFRGYGFDPMQPGS